MTRSRPLFNFHTQLFFPSHFGRTLLGLYFVLVELSESEVSSSGGGGSYGCRAIGTTTSTCRPVEVRPEHNPTSIHSPQLRLLVQKGDNVYLPCRVHNLGGNQVIWRHGNDIIAGSNLTTTFPRERHRLLPDFTLELPRVTAKDEGYYQCIVPAWPEANITHTISVLDPPTLNIEPDTGSVTVSEGDSVQIGCIPNGNPIPEITWTKQEGTIPLHPTWFSRRRILIENVSPRETGVYICRADNRVGKPATGSIYVRVLHAPEVLTPKRRVHGGVRQRIQLVCTVHADPKAEVQWLFEQKPVPLSGRFYTETRGNEHFLNIRSIVEKDFGSYFCIANNSMGYSMQHIEFSGVPNAPVVTRWETSACLDDGQNDEDDAFSRKCTVQVTLFWVVECYSSLIDYRLHFRSVSANGPVTSANEHRVPPWTELTIPADPTISSSTFLHSKSYTIHGLPNNTIYEGAVRARNKFGWSFLSPVFHFTSVPNAFLKLSEVGEAFKNYPQAGNRRNGNSHDFSEEEFLHEEQDTSETEMEPSSTPSTKFLGSFSAHLFILSVVIQMYVH